MSPSPHSVENPVTIEEQPAVLTSPLLFFDWDDTLHPSTVVAALRGEAVWPQEIKEQLYTLESAVVKMLNRAMEFGTVVIITNAETGWVELSAKRYMPRVLPVLANIPIVSARTTFERFFPDSPLDWKIAAFNREVNGYFAGLGSNYRKNVMSFGDSIHERNAVYRVTASLSNILTKSIKFVERPSVDVLAREVELVTQILEYVVNFGDNMDLVFNDKLLQEHTEAHEEEPVDDVRSDSDVSDDTNVPMADEVEVSSVV